MAKKITIQAKQVIDDEVIFDTITTYNSEKEFEAAQQEAIENWKDMQGDYAEIECYGRVCGLGECLKLAVNINDDYEEWNCIGYEEDKGESMRKTYMSFSSGKSFRFYNMGNRPLAYPVKCNAKIVIPEGTTGVKIAFGQSHLTYKDPETGRTKKMNVYLYKGRVYHA